MAPSIGRGKENISCHVTHIYRNLKEMILYIYQLEGLLGFYKGISINLIKVTQVVQFISLTLILNRYLWESALVFTPKAIFWTNSIRY